MYRPCEKEIRIKRKINYTRFTIEDIYDPSDVSKIPLLEKLCKKELSLDDENIKSDLCDILYSRILNICDDYPDPICLRELMHKLSIGPLKYQVSN